MSRLRKRTWFGLLPVCLVLATVGIGCGKPAPKESFDLEINGRAISLSDRQHAELRRLVSDLCSAVAFLEERITSEESGGSTRVRRTASVELSPTSGGVLAEALRASQNGRSSDPLKQTFDFLDAIRRDWRFARYSESDTAPIDAVKRSGSYSSRILNVTRHEVLCEQESFSPR